MKEGGVFEIREKSFREIETFINGGEGRRPERVEVAAEGDPKIVNDIPHVKSKFIWKMLWVNFCLIA